MRERYLQCTGLRHSASFKAQSVKDNDMACKRIEISTPIKDNGVDLFFVVETWLSAQGDEAKTVELALS